MTIERWCECGAKLRYRARTCDYCGMGKGNGVHETISWVTNDSFLPKGWLPNYLEVAFVKIEKRYKTVAEIPVSFCCRLCSPKDVNFIDDSFVCESCNSRICDFHKSQNALCKRCMSE